jgi:hypothetical protein
MKNRKINVSGHSSIFSNNELKNKKCKFAMNFFVDNISRFAIATSRNSAKFKYNSMNECFKDLCFSSLQIDLNVDLITNRLIETVKKSKEYKEVISNINNIDSCAAILMVNARFNEFKSQYQNDFDFEFKLLITNTSDFEVISKILLLNCNEVVVSEYEDVFFIDFDNPVSILLGTEYSEEMYS